MNYTSVTNRQTSIRQFRVFQWNGLAKSFCNEVDKPKSPKTALDWDNFRIWRLLEEIVVQNSDIICLQEADFYEDIKPYLQNLGYSGVFCPKYSTKYSNTKELIDPDGCAIFYRTSKFQINQLHIENVYVNGENQSQVFIILGLRHIVTRKRITIVCVHLKAHVEFAQKRSEQTEFILRTLKKHLVDEALFNNLKGCPVIICGDFNGEDTEQFYEQLVADPHLNLVDAYGQAVIAQKKQQNNRKPSVSASNLQQSSFNAASNRIDYIFYTAQNIRQVSYLELVGKRFDWPSLSYPSDHLSLVCDFQFNIP